MGRTDIAYNVEVDDVEFIETPLSSVSAASSSWTSSGTVEYCFIETGAMTADQLYAGICVDIPYRAVNASFKVVFTNNGQPYPPYASTTMFDAYASIYGVNLAKVAACRLKVINPDNQYLVQLLSGGRVLITSRMASDFRIRQVVYQDAFLLIRCAPGNLHRYPTIGGDVKRLMGATGDYSAVTNSIITTLNNDGIQINSLQFNRETGQLQIDVQ